MGKLIRKSHNVSLLMYHFVFVAKYRRLVINEEVDTLLKDVCLEISKRYEIRFLEIGTEGDHVHFLIQSVPMYSPKSTAGHDFMRFSFLLVFCRDRRYIFSLVY